MSAPPPREVIITAFSHLSGAKMFQLASYVFLLYDHLITFGEEVERIWKQPRSLATLLFFINRYVTPFEFAVVIAAFHIPGWTGPTESLTSYRCDNFVKYEGGGTVSMVAICEVIMILRVYALYHGNKVILVCLLLLLVAQLSVQYAALSYGQRVPLPEGFVGCILTGGGKFFWTFWAAPLVTDTVIFALTLWRTRLYFKQNSNMRLPLIQLFLRDGVMYFTVIFTSNFLNTMIYLLAVEDLKAVAASFNQMITSVMISRLVLNLRSLRHGHSDSDSDTLPQSRNPSMNPINFAGKSIIGNLGGHVGDSTHGTSSGEQEADYTAVPLAPIVHTHTTVHSTHSGPRSPKARSPPPQSFVPLQPRPQPNGGDYHTWESKSPSPSRSRSGSLTNWRKKDDIEYGVSFIAQ